MQIMKMKYLFLVNCMIFYAINGLAQKLPDHNLLKGIVALEKQEYDSAIVYFKLSEEEIKNHPAILLDLGISFLETGQNEKALQEFLKAEKIEKGIASYWISKVYARMNNIEKTLEYLSVNLNSKYKEPEKKILLDNDFQKIEKLTEWKEFWRSGKYYSSFDMTLTEADYLINNNNYPEALTFINDNLSKAYRKSPLLARRSVVYANMNNFRMAIEDINKAIEGDRRNTEFILQRAGLNMKMERYRQASEDFDQIIKIDPYKIHLYPQRAKAKNLSGLYESAVDDMNFYLLYFPEDHFTWYQFGKIHFLNQKYFSALECYHKALHYDQTRPEYFEARGETYLRTKTYRSASNDFSMSLDINPVNPGAYLNKGIAAVYLNNIAEACFCFEMAKKQGAAEADEYLLKHCRQ